MLTRTGQVTKTKMVILHKYPMGYILAFAAGWLLSKWLMPVKQNAEEKIPSEDDPNPNWIEVPYQRPKHWESAEAYAEYYGFFRDRNKNV